MDASECWCTPRQRGRIAAGLPPKLHTNMGIFIIYCFYRTTNSKTQDALCFYDDLWNNQLSRQTMSAIFTASRGAAPAISSTLTPQRWEYNLFLMLCTFSAVSMERIFAIMGFVAPAMPDVLYWWWCLCSALSWLATDISMLSSSWRLSTRWTWCAGDDYVAFVIARPFRVDAHRIMHLLPRSFNI